jgi:hypothetical protein
LPPGKPCRPYGATYSSLPRLFPEPWFSTQVSAFSFSGFFHIDGTLRPQSGAALSGLPTVVFRAASQRLGFHIPTPTF